MFEALKTLLGNVCCCDDEKLYEIIDVATDTILDIIGRDELPSRLESVVVQYAVILYNKQGAEGESARTQGGVTQNFIEDLPADLLRRLRNYPRKVRVIEYEND